MKNKTIIVITILCWVAEVACKKENTIEAIKIDTVPKNSAAYYDNLRAYKKTDHALYFGWFGGTSGEGNPNSAGILDGIPDSVDIVSLWGGFPPFGSHNHELIKKTQDLKGTRFVMVVFDDSSFLNKYSGGVGFAAKYNNGDSLLKIGFDIVARNVNDTIQKYQLSGIDFDHEPTVSGYDWGLLKYTGNYSLFMQAMSKYVGPKSGTDKLLIVDGEYNMSEEAGACLSYIASQAYDTYNDYSLNSRASILPNNFPLSRFIVTENFESNWKDGGVSFSDPIHGYIPSLLGMAYWNPEGGRKGGCGAYHAEYEYAHNPDYKYTRQAIQIMNPAAK